MIASARDLIGLGSLAAIAIATLCACGSSSMGGTGGASSSASSAGSGGFVGTGGAGGDTMSTSGTGGGGLTQPYVYVGTYGNLVHVFRLSLVDGSLTPAGAPVDAGTNPSFLAVDPGHSTLFAVNEDGGGKGAVASFHIDTTTGGLTFVSRVSSQGDGPAHVSTDKSGTFALVANYGGGTVAVLPVGPGGVLSDAVDVHDHGSGANPHQIFTDVSNTHAFVPNKGKDMVTQYGFDVFTGKLTDHGTLTVTPGSGPRHLDLHPKAPYAYLVNELGSTIVALAYDKAAGTLTELQTLSTLPAGFQGANTCAEVQVSPSGKFVYASNRGHDSIAIFAVQPDGKLTLVGHQPTMGKTPRHFHLDQTGQILVVANMDSDSVVTFHAHPETGLLTPTGTSVQVHAPSYAGVVFVVIP
ncbi:MAG: lactonase family protein [Minicystis sp.]